MKKTKIIVPALGMLLLSTAASVTGTVAWFAVNTSVTVTGLQVKAKAEGGIVIAPYSITNSGVSQVAGPNSKTAFAAAAPAETAFKNEADCDLDPADLYPTSTSDAAAWYHATSNNVNNYAAASEYSALSVTTDGYTYGGDGTADTPWVINGQYFLYNQYKVKSTSSDSTFGLYLRSITVTADGSNTALMDKALRVAIKAGTGAVKFYAPSYSTSEAETLEWYDASEGEAAVGSFIGGTSWTTNNLLTVNASEVDKTGIDLKIWVYYEGEDVNCTTYNVDKVTVDQLSLSFRFATTQDAA